MLLREQIEERLEHYIKEEQRLAAEINATIGAIQAYQEMLALSIQNLNDKGTV